MIGIKKPVVYKTADENGMLPAYKKPLDAADRRNPEGLLTFTPVTQDGPGGTFSSHRSP